MLAKLKKMGQSYRDETQVIGDGLKQKITEINQLPPEIPESWDERIDENGNPYFVDTDTGEWYRIVSDNNHRIHKRIDTNEKLSIITAENKKQFAEQKNEYEFADQSSSSGYNSLLYMKGNKHALVLFWFY